MFRLLINFVSYSTRSIGGCLTGMCMCFAVLLIAQWAIAAVVGAVSALPPAAIIALVLLAAGVAILPSPWRAVVVVATVAAVLIVPAIPAVLLVIVLPAAWVGRRFGAHIRPRSRGAHFASWWKLLWEGFLWHPWFRIRQPFVSKAVWESSLADQGWPIGGLRAGFTVCLPAARECEGVIAIAPPGSGKTSGPAVGAILSEADRPAGDLHSLVIGDPKNEVAKITMATLAQTHRVLVWDPGDPAACTVSFDPLSTLPHPSSDPRFPEEVADLAESWLQATRRSDRRGEDGDFWMRLASSTTRVALLTYLDEYPGGSFVDFADWIRSLTVEDLVDAVEHARSPYAHRFAGELRTLLRTERTAASGWVDVQSRFNLLDSPHIRAAMDSGRNPSIDWDEFVAQPTVLYLKLAARDAERLGPLLSLFLARMYRALTAIAARNPGNMLPRGVRVIIDEFGNLSRIYGIETALATLRSYNVGHYLLVQSTSQIRSHYGRDLAQSIQDHMVTKVILGGAADEDAKWMSSRCGERTQYHPTTNHTAGGLFRGSASFGHAPERQPLVTPAEIMHMQGTMLVSTRGLPPVRCKLMPYFRDRRTLARLEADARQWALTNPGGPMCTAAWPSPAASVPPVTPLPWSLPDLDDI